MVRTRGQSSKKSADEAKPNPQTVSKVRRRGQKQTAKQTGEDTSKTARLVPKRLKRGDSLDDIITSELIIEQHVQVENTHKRRMAVATSDADHDVEATLGEILPALSEEVEAEKLKLWEGVNEDVFITDVGGDELDEQFVEEPSISYYKRRRLETEDENRSTTESDPEGSDVIVAKSSHWVEEAEIQADVNKSEGLDVIPEIQETGDTESVNEEQQIPAESTNTSENDSFHEESSIRHSSAGSEVSNDLDLTLNFAEDENTPATNSMGDTSGRSQGSGEGNISPEFSPGRSGQSAATVTTRTRRRQTRGSVHTISNSSGSGDDPGEVVRTEDHDHSKQRNNEASEQSQSIKTVYGIELNKLLRRSLSGRDIDISEDGSEEKNESAPNDPVQRKKNKASDSDSEANVYYDAQDDLQGSDGIPSDEAEEDDKINTRLFLLQLLIFLLFMFCIFCLYDGRYDRLVAYVRNYLTNSTTIGYQ